MLKNEKGVTLTLLIATIIAMSIILGITMSSADDLLRNSQKNKIRTSMYMVQSKAEILLENYLFDETDNLGKEASLSLINKVGWEIGDTKYIYRVWDKDILNGHGIKIKDFLDEDSFIVRYDLENDEVDIAFPKGYVDKQGNIQYTLSSLEE